MMKTPICDFVENYKKSNKIRLHMPGHKGKNILGYEENDITEIDGADVLYHADGIIKESESNASEIFGCDTFYSAEGSSLCIRAMLFLALTNRENKTEARPYVIAARNVHKTFITAASLLDFDVDWIYSNNSYYHTCLIDAVDLEEKLANCKYLPFAIYLTSPDYLGHISNITDISKVCKKYHVPLLVDNAHGAYFKFLTPSIHPVDLGCDMCCDSAHKTLPTLTGAAYLHISNSADPYYSAHAKEAMNLFASTSPSYLILQSLDKTNMYISLNKRKYDDFCLYIDDVKKDLSHFGYHLVGEEMMKITIDCKNYGYSGFEVASYLNENNIVCEFYDNDFVVLMPSLGNTIDEIDYVKNCLLKLKKKDKIEPTILKIEKHKQIMSIKDAQFSIKENISVENACGRILASTAVTCPPAIPIVVCGEMINEEDIEIFKYYNIKELSVVKE